MKFEKALVAELRTISGLSTKIFPTRSTEATAAPYVVYGISPNSNPVMTLSGPLKLRSNTFNVLVYAKTYNEAQTFYEAIKDKIQSFLHRAIGAGDVYVQAVTLDDVFDDIVDELGLHYFNMEFKFYYEE